MNRFDVLNVKTPIFGHFFLEASAGTGKTFAIEHIVVRALLESSQPLTIDKILIVTFTRAATRELKHRVKNNLIKTQLALQQGVAVASYLSPIFQQGAGAVFSAQQRIEEAISCFDNASIFTLHGFCHRSLSDCAFETGIFFDPPTPEAMSHREKMHQVIGDFFRTQICEQDYSPAQLAILLKKGQGSMEELIKRISHVIERDLIIQAEIPFSSLVQKVELACADMAAGISLIPSLAWQDLEQLLPLYKRSQEVDLTLARQFCEMMATGGSLATVFDQLLFCKESFLSVLLHDNLKKGKDPSLLKLNYPGLWADAARKLCPLIEKGKDPSALFLRAASDCMKLWKTSCHYEQSLSADDLLRKMAEAVSIASFKEKIAEKYQLAIIDEFQDTDPLQWYVFDQLFVRGAHVKTIYLVGDPKQSIYAFRNADVYTYLKALQTLGENNRLVLDTNFRSKPSLVKALNTLFTCNISPQWMQLPAVKGALDVHPVNAKDPFAAHEEPQERSSIHFFIAEGSIGRGRRWPSDDIERLQFFPFIAGEIVRLKKQQGYAFGQIAILVRDRFQAERLEDALKEYDIPSHGGRGIDLSTSAGYIALYDLICAALRPYDIAALKRVLAGPLVGYPFCDLIGGMELCILQEARVYFEKAKREIPQLGWGAFFSRFLSSSWGGSPLCVEELLLQRPNPSLYFEIRKLLQVMQNAAGTLLFSLEPFETYYLSLAHLAQDDEQLNVVPETEKDQVVIMTIHASKGLEFDVVFALGLAQRSSSSDDLIFVRLDERSHLTSCDDHDPVSVLAKEEADAEKMRHLYVALTRAKDRVYIPVAVEKDKKALALSCASPIELLIQGFGQNQYCFSQAYRDMSSLSVDKIIEHLHKLSAIASIGYTLLSSESAPASAVFCGEKNYDLLFSPPVKRLFFPRRRALSFSSLHKESVLSRPTASSQEDTTDTLPVGVDTGLIVHSIMEEAVSSGLHCLQDESQLRGCVERLVEGGDLEPFTEVVFQMVKESLQVPLGEGVEVFSLCQVHADHFFVEMEFCYEHCGQQFKGFIDAICEYGGKYYIIDWKTNFLGHGKQDYSREKIDQAMKDHEYFLQAAIYTEALKRYLSIVESKPFDEVFGGAIYLFMRKREGYHFIPDVSIIENSLKETKSHEP